MFKELRSTKGEVNLLLISTLLLGLTTMIFGVLAIYAYTINQQTQKATNVIKTAVYKHGQEAQIYESNYKDLVKQKKLTQKSVTVSGIGGTWLDGKFDSTHTGVIVLVPVRDKTLEFITDSHDYLNEFNQILSLSTILR